MGTENNDTLNAVSMIHFARFNVCSCVPYVQEVVTLQKKYLIYLHQKMRFTPLINYYDTLG